jgi:hypothetical protein
MTAKQKRPDGLVPGVAVEKRGWYHKACKTCHAGVLMARVKYHGQRLWKALESTPHDLEGVRYYQLHVCGRAPANQGAPERDLPQKSLL